MVKLERHRYIVFEIISDRLDITEDNIKNTLWNQIFRLYGEFGTSQTGLWIIYYDPENKRGVIRTSLTYYENVRAALAMITSIFEKQNDKTKRGVHDVIFHVLGVTGTIKTIKEKYFFVPNKNDVMK